MIVEIPIIYREPLAIARVCANAHVSIIIISSSNNDINVSNDSRDTYYISGETYPSTRISETRLLRVRSESCAMATLLKNLLIRARPSSSATKFESFVRRLEKMLTFPISTFFSIAWEGLTKLTMDLHSEIWISLWTCIVKFGSHYTHYDHYGHA